MFIIDRSGIIDQQQQFPIIQSILKPFVRILVNAVALENCFLLFLFQIHRKELNDFVP